VVRPIRDRWLGFRRLPSIRYEVVARLVAPIASSSISGTAGFGNRVSVTDVEHLDANSSHDG
jgi:hypothetical protein